MKLLSTILLLCLCSCTSPQITLVRFGQRSPAQAHLPNASAQVMGFHKQYSVVCKICEYQQTLIPVSVRIIKSTPILNGESQVVEFGFLCTNPTCGHAFTWRTTRQLQAPVPGNVVRQLKLQKASALPPKPVKHYLAWDYPGTNGPVAFQIEHSPVLPPHWEILTTNCQASPFLVTQEGYFRVGVHRP